MRSVLLLGMLLFTGCDSLREELPGLYAAAPQVAARDAVEAKAEDHGARLARRLETRLKTPAMPELANETECSRAQLEIADGDARRLMLAYVDARSLTKNLIARRVSERLESGERGLLETMRDDQANALALRRDVPRSAISMTSEDLRRIERQRYLGVFYLTDYQAPALILRVGKIRREWYPGQLSGKFFLFDTEAQRTICGTSLHVVNEVKSAPIRARLQSETRGRLERALGDAMREAAQRTLAHGAPQLEWPESGLSQGS